jgi:hypothetical protein
MTIEITAPITIEEIAIDAPITIGSEPTAANVAAIIAGADEKTTPEDTDNLALESGGILKRLSWANLLATAKTYFDTLYLVAVSWGGITGTLSEQTDLQSALDNKAAAYHNHQAGIDGEPLITAGSGADAGKVQIAAVSAWFYDDATLDALAMHEIAASGFLTLTDDVENFICASRDTDAWVVLTTKPAAPYLTHIPYVMMYKVAGSDYPHSQLVDIQAHGEVETHHERVWNTDKYEREPGALENLAVADTTLALTLAGGVVYPVNRKYTITAVTPATRQFECEVTGGVWSYSSHTAPVLVNTSYNDATAGLVPLTDDYYGIMYVYRGIEEQDHLYTVYSPEQFASLELAQASKSIGAQPPLALSHAMFIGRIIFQKGQTSAILTESAFDTVFQASTPMTAHGAMSGRNDSDQHSIGAITDLTEQLAAKQPTPTLNAHPAIPDNTDNEADRTFSAAYSTHTASIGGNVTLIVTDLSTARPGMVWFLTATAAVAVSLSGPTFKTHPTATSLDSLASGYTYPVVVKTSDNGASAHIWVGAGVAV